MTVVRFLGNLILAILLGVLALLLLIVGYGFVVSREWEHGGLAYKVDGERWLWIDEEPVYYQEWGPKDGKVVVLVHGLDIAGGEGWRANAQSLAGWGIRVIAADLRGFGHSVRTATPSDYTLRKQAELLAKVLNELRIREATVVGHGWGSAVALQLASEQPQFVAKIALVSPQVYEDPMRFWRPVAKVPYLSQSLAWLVATGGPFRPLFQRWAMVHPSKVDTSYWRRSTESSRIVGTIDAVVAMGTATEDSDLPGTIRSLDIPALILWGEDDPCAPLESVRRLESELPDARLSIFPDAGHYLALEQSATVSRKIAEFCQDGIR